MNKSEQHLILVRIPVENEKELDWLHQFIHENYNVREFMLPTKEDLKGRKHRFFRAFATTGPETKSSEPIGVTGYEAITPYLVETQKTIVSKKFRGGGWGRALSLAIEKEVEKAGFHKIRTCIYHDNFAMIHIKLLQGYVIEGFHQDHDGPGLHEYSLGKVLGPS